MCDLGVSLTGGQPIVVGDGGQQVPEGLTFELVPSDSGRIWLVGGPESGVVRLLVVNRWRGTLRWFPDGEGLRRCEPESVGAEMAGVYGRVANMPQTPTWVAGCGALVRVEAGGEFFVEAFPGPCGMFALTRGQDGVAVGAAKAITPVLGVDLEVVLDGPDPLTMSRLDTIVEAKVNTRRVLEQTCLAGWEPVEDCMARLVAPLDEEVSILQQWQREHAAELEEEVVIDTTGEDRGAQ